MIKEVTGWLNEQTKKFFYTKEEAEREALIIEIRAGIVQNFKPDYYRSSPSSNDAIDYIMDNYEVKRKIEPCKCLTVCECGK